MGYKFVGFRVLEVHDVARGPRPIRPVWYSMKQV